MPPPQPSQHFPNWELYIEEVALEVKETSDLSNAVPYGLGVTDRDAVDPCTRAWLEWLRSESVDFRLWEVTVPIRGKTYKSFCGIIPEVCRTSAVHRLRRGLIPGLEPLPFCKYGRKVLFLKLSIVRWRERNEKSGRPA